MALLDWFKQLDSQWFVALNGMHTAYLDAFFSWFTCKEVWYPFYLVLLYLLIQKYKRSSAWIIFLLILSIVASDQLSGLIKFLTERPRPSHESSLAFNVHTTFVGKGGAYGFVSSHAANAFALAIFTGLTLRCRKILISLLIWSTITAYSRIYVGVHYPFDVVVGGLLGAFIGWGAFRTLNHFDIRHLRKEIAKNSSQKPTIDKTLMLSLSLITITIAVVSFLMLKYKIPF